MEDFAWVQGRATVAILCQCDALRIGGRRCCLSSLRNDKTPCLLSAKK
jgi:hypothetical protein